MAIHETLQFVCDRCGDHEYPVTKDYYKRCDNTECRRKVKEAVRRALENQEEGMNDEGKVLGDR